MNKIDLELKIEGLKKAIAEHKDFTGTYESDLAKAKKQLDDYNKPELTPMMMDNIWEAINDAISDFDFDDSENYEFEYEIDYDGRVNCSSVDFQPTDELIDKIVAKVTNLFKEADCPEDEPTSEQLDTTEPDHHAPVESPDPTPIADSKPSKEDMENFNERVQAQKQESQEKTFKKRTWFK